MERDFLGLNSKESFTDGYREFGYSKSSGLQWPFSNKVSAVPQMMNFNFGQGDKLKKIGSDSLGFIPISTADSSEVQKSFNHNRQGGSYFPLTTCSVQHDVYPVQYPNDAAAKMFPVSDQAISFSSMSKPFMKSPFATAGQNFLLANMRPQLLGGIQMKTPHTVLPTLGSVGVGGTETWNSVKASGSPAQLTIFYGGTVNVYDDITADKAQAIMCMAGKGSSVPSNVPHPKIQVQTPIPKPVQVDSVPVNQLMNTQPSCGISSPLSVSSHTDALSGSGSTSSDKLMVCKTKETMQPSELANTMGSVFATGMIPSIPQARKASLARFLEKRKERITSVAPYNLSKKPIDYATMELNA